MVRRLIRVGAVLKWATPGVDQVSPPGIGLLLEWDQSGGGKWRHRVRDEMRQVLAALQPIWL